MVELLIRLPLEIPKANYGARLVPTESASFSGLPEVGFGLLIKVFYVLLEHRVTSTLQVLHSAKAVPVPKFGTERAKSSYPIRKKYSLDH